MDEPHKVHVLTSYMEGRESKIREVLLPYAEALQKNIYVQNMHGGADRLTDGVIGENALAVLFWATPATLVSHTKITSAFGIRLTDGQPDSSRPSDSFVDDNAIVKNISDDNGIVAQVCRNRLYILFDLPHGPNISDLLCAIMDAYMGLLREPAEIDYAQRLQKLYDKTKDTLCSKAQLDVAAFESRAESLSTQLRDACIGRREAQTSLAALRAMVRNNEVGKKEYAALCKLDKVERVVVQLGNVTITTEPLHFTYADTVYTVGKIKISLNPGAADIRIQSTQPVHGYSHPHVSNGGTPCFGNLETGIYKLIANFELAVAAQLILQFLQECNESGWYLVPTEWPKVPTEARVSAPSEIRSEDIF